MSHGHHSHRAHRAAPDPTTSSSRLWLVGLTLALLVATIVGLVLLWPAPGSRPDKTEYLAEGVEMVTARITEVPADSGEVTESVQVQAEGTAGDIAGRTITVDIPPEVAADGIEAGDRIRVLAIDTGAEADADGETVDGEQAGGPAVVHFYLDHERTLPLALLFVAYLVLVALVARGAGLRAMLGLAAGVAIVIAFMLPAILAGESPVLVALVAGSAMIFPCVYFAHGISVRTTTAVLGTFGGIAVTVVAALATGDPTGMTGAHGESSQMLHGTHPQVSLSALFLAGVIVSGLGALNDVTITQASSVWELRSAMPEATRWQVFSSAMRIGRDHIASTVYTLAYAYIGSALPMLLYASTLDRSLVDTITSGEVAAEVFRTLIASIGLVLAIPATTGIATLLAPGGSGPRRSSREVLEERLGH